MAFKKAVRSQRKLRLAIAGPTGSGKTYTALAVAKGLGGSVALIDTERHSASLYADEFEFDSSDLAGGNPEAYTRQIEEAAKAGYDVLIIDSFSHAWAGEDGILAQKDKAAKRQRGGNDFTAWRDVTPMHDRLVSAVLDYPGHVIVTMRAKMAYAMVEEKGKTKVEKLGLAPVQRDGVEYEFDVVVDMDQAHTGVVSKTRARFLDNAVIEKPGAKLGRDLVAWLGAGVEAPAPAPQPEPQAPEQAEPRQHTGQVTAPEWAVKGTDFAARAIKEMGGAVSFKQRVFGANAPSDLGDYYSLGSLLRMGEAKGTEELKIVATELRQWRQEQRQGDAA